MTEEERNILKDIESAQLDKKEAETKMSHHKTQWISAETDAIAANNKILLLKERLRVHLSKYPHPEETLREKEIREFSQRLPELLKKI